MCFSREPSKYCPVCWVLLWCCLTAFLGAERWDILPSPLPPLSINFSSVLCRGHWENPLLNDCVPTERSKWFWLHRGVCWLIHLLGLWVVSCMLFYFAACHGSCHTCVGPEPNHCTQCKKPEAGLQVEQHSGENVPYGKCVSKCGAHFYLESTGLCEGKVGWQVCSYLLKFLWGGITARGGLERPLTSCKQVSRFFLVCMYFW